MTKETSRRSSVSGSAHASLPPANGTDSPLPDPQQPSEAPSTIPGSPSPARDAPKSAESDVPSAPAAESQPMTASNSSSSSPAPNNTAGSSAAGAVPYGTRSRNRNGAARPNYAEDKELDMDFEVTAPAKEPSGRKAPRGADQSPASQVETGRATSSVRRALNDATQSVTVQSHYKEQIPGTSTFSANLTSMAPVANQLSTKKRKAASASQSQAHTPTHGSSIERKGGMATPLAADFRESNMLSFDNCAGRLKDQKLIADDGTVLEANDHVYLVCEPPGEPYYLGRIMEFLHVNNDKTQPIDALRLNWYYRPKDIGRKVTDTRQVFASMHSDISPLTALRGKCQIKHKSEIDNVDELRKIRDCFWYDRLYDRYIHRFYDVIPTSMVINVPAEVKKVLDERWKFIVVEPGRGKELTSAVKSCKRCSKYCANNDSVDCAVCRSTYHMSCVNPPLLKKPSRGFAWACGPCSKAQEKRLEARNTPNTSDAAADAEDDDFLDEEDDFTGPLGDSLETGQTSPARSPEPGPELAIHPGTAEQIHQAGLWLFRYLGIHCKVEDALDYDDRIYPRASSRLGPRHQANVMPWPGRPVKYVKSTEVKRKYGKGGYQKKDTKPAKETVPASDTEKGSREERPKWIMDEPPGYIPRGEDHPNDDPRNTARLLFDGNGVDAEIAPVEPSNPNDATSDSSSREQLVIDYMERLKKLAKPLGLPELSTNLLDVGLEMLHANGYNPESALEAVSTVDRKAFKEPELSPAELKRFEDGVAKYGSEWHSIKNHVKTVRAGDIVRFYYTWKKTERGKQIWGNYSGRKGKKEAKKSEPSEGKLQDDVADDHDDSAFDNEKALERKKGFQCKFCGELSSRQWRRAPNTPAGTLVTENSNGKTALKEKAPQLLVALCSRCAELWRRYAVQWESADEVTKKAAQGGGRVWKRKIDEELLKELAAANELTSQANSGPSGSISANGTPAPGGPGAPFGSEPPRKKMKGVADKDLDPSLDSGGVQQRKKALAEKPNAAPPVPELPKPRLLPCAVCGEMDPSGDQRLSCKDCRMTVHRNCYGIVDSRSASKWTCDMCSNDKNPQVSIQYKCVLCPVEFTEHDFTEPPKNLSKKKNDKDRERDRLERENAQRAADYFRKKQEERNKPTNPREPLKCTVNNNWVHVTCAVFTPEVKFGNAKLLTPSEGIPSIATARYDEVCKACKQKGGACVSCHSCRAPMHVECARQAGYVLGFDIVPVKGSRRDQFSIVTVKGETGTMTAAVWCKEHAPTKTIVHRMNDSIDDTGVNVLQRYVRSYKQADGALTGTMRKANLINQSTRAVNPVASNLPSHRRASTSTTINGSSLPVRGSVSHTKLDEPLVETSPVASIEVEKTCVTCGIDVSPKWYPCPPGSVPALANGAHPPVHESVLSGAPTSESGAGHVALAAAALHQNGQNPMSMSSNVQCHKCHSKKIRNEPTPAPAAPTPRDEPRLSIPPPISSAHRADADVTSTAPSYGWPQPPSYAPNGPYNNWSRHSPAPPAVAPVHQLNGHHSPHVSAGPPASNQSQFRQPSQQPQLVQPGPPSVQPVQPVQPIQPVQLAQPAQQVQPAQPISRSPHQNGQMAQPINGYPASPHRSMSSSSHHIQNGPYASFASTRPTPQHLTNGGPPPRAPEHPFSQGNAHSHPPPPFVLPPHGSPPMQRESNPQGREHGTQQNGTRPGDGRVNGGASASPSLRNLLS